MKAILIIDKMPERCGDCPLLQGWYDDEYKKRFDMCFWRYCEIKYTEGKLKGCPLKPLPQIKEERLKYLHDIGASTRELQCYVIGHDDCIDEILGGKE